MVDEQTVLFYPDPEVLRLLDDNGIRLERALAEYGIVNARTRLVGAGEASSREPITAIIIASSVPILALGSAITQIVRALHSGPVKVTSDVVLIGADGSVAQRVDEHLVQPTVEQTVTELKTTLPLGISVSLTTGKKS